MLYQTQRHSRYWGKEEINILKEEYGKLSTKEISTLIGRDIKSIHAKVAKLKIIIKKQNKWRKEELDFLIDNYNNLSSYKISILIKRTLSSVTGMISRIGLKKPKIKGEKSPGWKGGITKLTLRLRESVEYKIWRTLVFKRDNYKCQECGINNNTLEGHHIIPFSVLLRKNNIKDFESALRCKELWETDNGQTLCRECHLKTESYGYKSRIDTTP